MQQQLSPTQISPIPDDIDSPRGKLVYLYLEATGGATLEDVTETLSMKKIDALSVLQSLSGANLVEKTDSAYVVANYSSN